MTISTTTNRVAYLGNAVTKIFAVPFYFLLDADLVVTTTTGSTTVALGLNSDYTVSGHGDLGGGALTLSTAPGATTTLTIVRLEPITQLTDYVQDDAFPAESHEKALDKLTMICQQLSDKIDQAVITATTSGEVNTVSNIGGGLNLYKQKVASDLQFRTISSPSNGTFGMAIIQDRIEIDVRAILNLANSWYGGMQYLEYHIPTVPNSSDHVGWSGLVHNNIGSINKDNMLGLRGHGYHDGNWSNDTGGVWGIATEAWSNPLGTTTLVGGEFSVIAQKAANSYPSVGINLTFKNRLDGASHPVAGSGDGSYYNQLSRGLMISSQNRPSGAGAAWVNAGSGWNSAIRIGDLGFGSGLDWEGGSGATTGDPAHIRNFSTVIDMTYMNDGVYGACRDLAGGFPWLALWRNGLTYFGIRFNAQITTGEIQVVNHTPVVAGTGYANGNTFTVATSLLGGIAATGVVDTVGGSGEVLTYHLTTAGTLYSVRPATAPYATTATSGGGTNLAIEVMQVKGERLEFWRMLDPGNLTTGAVRHGFVDFAYTEFDQDGSFTRNHL